MSQPSFRHSDHYIGRKCMKVLVPKNASPGLVWSIELEGEVFFNNYDPTKTTLPNEIVGKSLQAVTYTEHGEVGGDVGGSEEFWQETNLQFGRTQVIAPDEFEPFDISIVKMTAGKYTISDQGTEETPVLMTDPELAAYNKSLVPPDPSHLRAAEAPLTAPEATEA